MVQRYNGPYGPPTNANVNLNGVARLDQTNAFNKSNSNNIVNLGIKANTTVVIDARAGNSQKFTVAGPCVVNFSNWELATHITPVLVTITNAGSSSLDIPNVTWVNPSRSQEYATLLEYLQSIGRSPASLNPTGKERFVFWTENGGTTVLGRFQ